MVENVLGFFVLFSGEVIQSLFQYVLNEYTAADSLLIVSLSDFLVTPAPRRSCLDSLLSSRTTVSRFALFKFAAIPKRNLGLEHHCLSDVYNLVPFVSMIVSSCLTKMFLPIRITKNYLTLIRFLFACRSNTDLMA